MQNVSDIIDRLGGTSSVASALALTPSTVSSWKTSGKIPLWRRPSLLALAKERDIPLSEADFSLPKRGASADAQAAA